MLWAGAPASPKKKRNCSDANMTRRYHYNACPYHDELPKLSLLLLCTLVGDVSSVLCIFLGLSLTWVAREKYLRFKC